MKKSAKENCLKKKLKGNFKKLKKIYRYPRNNAKLYFKKNKKIIPVDSKIFYNKYNVHSEIKLLSSEFKLIKKKTKIFTHFNIQYTDHKPGMKYLIIKILKHGYFDGSFNKPPILCMKNFILAKCLSVQNNIDYVNLKEKVFKYSLSNIKNINALKKAIKRRYKKTLSHLSDTEKLSLGIAITELKIIKRF